MGLDYLPADIREDQRSLKKQRECYSLELFGVNIFSMAMPKRPLRVNKIIDDTPSDDIATRMITVDRTNPVFLARLPKSV